MTGQQNYEAFGRHDRRAQADNERALGHPLVQWPLALLIIQRENWYNIVGWSLVTRFYLIRWVPILMGGFQ